MERKESVKLGFKASLYEAIITTGKCAGCGACVVACPFSNLRYVRETPTLEGECKECGLCSKACPKFEWSLPQVESFFFGRGRAPQEEFGIYSRMLIAKATDEKVLRVCQDGGLVTVLIISAFESDMIDGAITSGLSPELPLLPKPRLIESASEALECAGTRYSYSPNVLALREAVEKKKRSLAFVGVPCHVQAIRKMQMAGLKKYIGFVKFVIGLMCTESFKYEGLAECIKERLGARLDDVINMNIKKDVFIRLKSGDVKTIPLAHMKRYARGCCSFCGDFSSELADISAGGLGLSGKTFAIIRTKAGEGLIKIAEERGMVEVEPIRGDEPSLKLLSMLTKAKRKRVMIEKSA